MKPPKQYFRFPLWWLNRVFRAIGFVLVIETGGEDTMIFFMGRGAYDNWCKQFCREDPCASS